MIPDAVRCYGCRDPIPEQDVWWLTIPKGGKVTVCGSCWSVPHALKLTFDEWLKRQRAYAKPRFALAIQHDGTNQERDHG